MVLCWGIVILEYFKNVGDIENEKKKGSGEKNMMW